MGIHGIYKEIGPGKRIALSKLAVQKFEETGRPLRIAIDTSIWLFQIQASKGGTNPALRTFYYRLLRLIALSIHPVFVFDGPNKPPFKRNKRTGPNVASIPEFLAKQLLKQFGYPIHLAPGEAEAECALLQREGIVDAVLSEDVDTLMFGSGITIRNWSPEKSGKTPTHVNVYDAIETKNGPSGLDREGMILVAMMSGGDYVPEGIPGCGPKTACEAAKAGFGHDLCKLPRGDARALREWKERLQHELKTNENKLFKRKHNALKIPDDFPRLDILGYYTHPAISSQAGLDKLRRSIKWDQDLDFKGLREFSIDAFDWAKLEGAKHFVRSLAPCMVVRQLRLRSEQVERLPTRDLQAVQEDETLLIKSIHGKRQHPDTDNETELRVSFSPIELVKIDLSIEDPDDEPVDVPPSSQLGEAELDDDIELEEEGPKKRGPTKFDPHKPARIWVLESFVKVGVPLKVQDWEAQRQAKSKPQRAANDQTCSNATARSKPGTRRTKTTNDAPQLQIQQFAKVTKPGSRLARALEKTTQPAPDQESAPPASPPRSQMSVVDLLSSSPARAHMTAPITHPARTKSPTPILEPLPSSVTKRRRRAPMQRAYTLPTNATTIPARSTTPPLNNTVEMLDLLSSPAMPSPSQIFAKKTKTTNNVARSTSVLSSPGKGRQTTLDAWRASGTPTKLRQDISIDNTGPMLTPPRFQHSTIVEELDLTLSSPGRPLPHSGSSNGARHPRRMDRNTTKRPPLRTVSSNASNQSARSSEASKPDKPASNCSKVTSQRGKSSSLEPDTLDLISSPPVVPAEASLSNLDILDLTTLSPPPPANPTKTKNNHIATTITSYSPEPSRPSHSTLRRSPRNHKSSSPDPQPRLSPPAAWKAREKKKRQIILRKSIVGAWDFVDVDSPAKGESDGLRIPEISRGKEKERRKWRESQVEFLDLT